MSVDFYALYHKGLRKRLFAAVAEAGAADVDVAATRAALTATVTTLVATLRTHARHEDQWFQPLIARAAPETHALLAAEHEALEPLADAIEAALARALVERTAAAATALYEALNRFTAAYLPHLAREESTMPVLWARLPAAELEGTYAAFLRSLPAADLLASFGVMLPALNGDERRGLMTRVPPPLERDAWAVAASVLDGDALERLRDGVRGRQ